MIKRSKNREEKPDFDDIVNDIELEVETQQVEQDIANRLSELKQLSSAIDKVTIAVINAQLTLESAIRQTHREEGKLGEAVLKISNKVDSINQNIDKGLDDAPTKLKVSVTVSDADWQKINKQFAEQRERMINEYRKQFREINDMLTNERKAVQKRYKEYDGCYLGYYAQWFFWFFFTIGIAVFVGVISVMIAQYYKN
jgi:chromosome segregation ATPase